MLLQLKVVVLGCSPKIWRRILVPANATLHDLHAILQIVMEWKDYHLHEFAIDDVLYGVPHPEDAEEVIDERKVRLARITAATSRFVYRYDFGDEWILEIEVERSIEGNDASAPACVEGDRAAPPEDSGGPHGYAEKVRVLRRPSHREYKEVRSWIGADFDPDVFNAGLINRRLKMAARKKAAAAKKRLLH